MPILQLKHPEKFFERPAVLAYLLSIFLFERLNPSMLKLIGYYTTKPIGLIWMFPLGLLLSITVFAAIVVPCVWLFRTIGGLFIQNNKHL